MFYFPVHLVSFDIYCVISLANKRLYVQCHSFNVADSSKSTIHCALRIASLTRTRGVSVAFSRGRVSRLYHVHHNRNWLHDIRCHSRYLCSKPPTPTLPITELDLGTQLMADDGAQDYLQTMSLHLVHTNRALPNSVQAVSRSISRPGLRSCDTAIYVKPRCRTWFGERGFSHAGPIYCMEQSFTPPPSN